MLKTIILFLSINCLSFCQDSYQLAILKYNGGGDWYANPSSLTNLAIFCNEYLNMNIEQKYAIVEPSSSEIFNYPFVHMTGHGNVLFNKLEIENLRKYLMGGGFLHIDDNYGMDQYIRNEMKKVFPELDFVQIPITHNIYNNIFKFDNGLPKIHIHDNKPAEGLAMIHKGRIICFYSYESDLGDGWEDINIHNDPEYIREKALKMGANIISYAMNPVK
jgi:hypothetical protein